jgi:hypothetical protein
MLFHVMLGLMAKIRQAHCNIPSNIQRIEKLLEFISVWFGARISQSVYRLEYGLDNRGIVARFPKGARESPPPRLERPGRLWGTFSLLVNE